MATVLSFAVKSIVPKLLGGVGIALTVCSVGSIINNRIYDEEKIANNFKEEFIQKFINNKDFNEIFVQNAI